MTDFPDHVMQMHEDMNHKFETEFIVSYDRMFNKNTWNSEYD